MSGLYYLGIIEGALHAKGEDAYPVKVWHALRMLGEELKAPLMFAKDTVVAPKIQEAISRGITEAKGEIAMDGKWLDWQINTLKTMKAAGEKADAIAKACEKTQTQVNNKWHSIKKTLGEIGEMA